MTNKNIDIDALRLTSTLSDELMGEEMKSPPEVRKPGKQMFFRSHPSQDCKLDTALLWSEEEIRWYMLSPTILPQIGEELTPVCIVRCIDLYGDEFLWPVKQPPSDGRTCNWNKSAQIAVIQSTSRWIRMTADMKKQKYRIFMGGSDLPEPNWSERTLSDLINEWFHEYYITTMDHPVIKKLRGRK